VLYPIFTLLYCVYICVYLYVYFSDTLKIYQFISVLYLYVFLADMHMQVHQVWTLQDLSVAIENSRHNVVSENVQVPVKYMVSLVHTYIA
jgi:hypothetical protein